MDPTPAELALLPALAPPPGVVPNFVDPPNFITTINITLALCVSIATITTWLRLYTKLYIMKRFSLEDYIVIIAWVGFIVFESLSWACSPYGSGIHQWNVNIPNFIIFVQKSYINEIIYSPVMFFTKLAILLQYIRIFVPNHKTPMFYFIMVIIIIIGCFYTSSLFISIFQCVPKEKLWDPTLPGFCVNYPITLMVVGIFNASSDLVILILPMAWIWGLKMSTPRKIGVSAIFAFGAFACAMSLLRVVLSARYNADGDATWDLSALALAVDGEIASGILCANLPVLPRFFTHFGPKVVSVFTSYRSFGHSVSSVKEISKGSAPRRSVGIPSIKHQKGSMEPHLLEAQGSYFELDERDNKSAPSFGSGEML